MRNFAEPPPSVTEGAFRLFVLIAASFALVACSHTAAPQDAPSTPVYPTTLTDLMNVESGATKSLRDFTFTLDPGKTVSGVLTVSAPPPHIALNVGWEGNTVMSFHTDPDPTPTTTHCIGVCSMPERTNSTSGGVTVNVLYWYTGWTRGDLEPREVTYDPNGKIATIRLFLVNGHGSDNFFISVR